MDKHLVKIIKDISIETGIPIYKVELIVMSEFHKKNGRKKYSKDTI